MGGLPTRRICLNSAVTPDMDDKRRFRPVKTEHGCAHGLNARGHHAVHCGGQRDRGIRFARPGCVADLPAQVGDGIGVLHVESSRAGTHMTAPERNSRLSGLLCNALVWMTRIGAQRTETHAPLQDKRGRAVVIVTRIGWQILRYAARWIGEVLWDCLRLLGLPFPDAWKSGFRNYRSRG